MTQWYFWGDKQFADIYENIYIRTFVEDWFKIVQKISEEIKGGKIIDIGCGEGHTTKQILDRVKNKYICDLVEPNKKALISAKKFLKFENKIGNSYVNTLSTLRLKKQYDLVFTSHTNYYWAINEKGYRKQLIKILSFVKKGGKLMILTLPEKSDHYNIMLKQVYPKFNYSEYIANFYRKRGLNVRVKRFRMRMYVGDMVRNHHLFDLNNFYRFIHNTNKYPNKRLSERFRTKIRKFQKNGYLDFKDALLIVEKG
ncbi:class I SAM-dependent methyltransferase [Candidatus Pacearchaeota archaeon]|nr:class I SAM-dependent methyltransferase [Candidatus Pacearchaeota archaeon]